MQNAEWKANGAIPHSVGLPLDETCTSRYLVAMQGLPQLPEQDETPPTPKPRRPWAQKFRDALRGLKFGIRGHSSFFVHFFAAALVVAGAAAVECSAEQWGLLLLCIGVVLTAELFNSAVETLHRGLDAETRERTWKALDIAAGAVLMASLSAMVVGLLVFGKRAGQLLGWFG